MKYVPHAEHMAQFYLYKFVKEKAKCHLQMFFNKFHASF